VSPDQTIQILQQLLVASAASTEAYRSAAFRSTSLGFSTLFSEYAKDHGRIASWLTRQIARVCRDRKVSPPPMPQAPVLLDREVSILSTDPNVLLGECIALQDSVVAAFGAAKDSLSGEIRRFITRELERLRWAREGLDLLRQERPAPRPTSSGRNVMEQLRLLEAQSFEPERFVSQR
jgi:hypothetical protein